ncbi:response regulator [Hymenobacter metallicola]|uniref:Response regulator n=1 Tax=Hymenobacter metallicola TaxID=2563114 RepID=A0A4Z0QFJ0_9BACT|nr:response regulator [Hymenobacter metallicola]TGE28109.1 response regulator [Hymenobacter metallicola]
MALLSSVLLVDDNSTTNFLHKLLLDKMGVSQQVFVAENGEQALRALVQLCSNNEEATCPQLIFLDMNMPVLNGLGFLEAYTHLPLAQRQAIVIVMLTTSLHERDMARARELPVAGFLTKPLTTEKVKALLAQHFPLAASSEGGA